MSVRVILLWCATVVAVAYCATVAPIEIDVAVVGLGLAGVEIMTLAKKDGRVAVGFEASPIPGGRTRPIKVGNWTLPKGAGWQSGTGSDHPLTNRLRVCDIKSNRVNWDKWIDFCADGEECGEAWEAWETSFACASELSTTMKGLGLPAVSQDTGLKLCGWQAVTDDELLVQTSTINFEWAEIATVNSLQESLPLITHELYNDADRFITDQRGPSELAGCWLDRFGIGRNQSAQVNYNSPVVHINTDTRVLTLQNGTRYRYQVLFNTMSLGALAWNQIHENGSLFTPKLSVERVRALYGYHTPLYNKIFLQFPTAFWNSYARRVQYFNIFATALHECTIFQNMDIPDWLEGSRILYLTCTSPQADAGENLSENDWVELIMPQLRRVFGATIPNPNLVVVANWRNDPWFRGTYSNAPVEHTLDNFNAFYAPIGSGGSHIFTGEAYCYAMFGYMHAAILAAETSWCEYQVRIGAYNPSKKCREVAVDADGRRLPNYCWDEGIATARKRDTGARFARSGKLAAHNPDLDEEEFQDAAMAKLAKAISIVTGH